MCNAMRVEPTGLNIPLADLEAVHLSVGAEVELVLSGDKLQVQKVRPRPTAEQIDEAFQTLRESMDPRWLTEDLYEFVRPSDR
jgi:antitoxin component of MazEF toxin-antitoxin module